MKPANTLKLQLLDAIEEMLAGFVKKPTPSPLHITVALSGGLDSMVLLQLAHLYAQSVNNQQEKSDNKASTKCVVELSALHINHGISAYAKQWELFCQSQCEQREISFYCQSTHIQKQAQQSLEADARTARYELINSHIEKMAEQAKCEHCIVLLGQHQNDQAETFLLQLQRGAGVKGLSCMPFSQRRDSKSHYMRPLLAFSRQQLHMFAEQEQLQWVEDESNQDQNFERNFVRHSVLPLLQNKWPHISKTISRSANLCAQAQDVIDEYMHLLAADLRSANNSVCIAKLIKHSPATQASFIRYWLQGLSAQLPSQAQLSDILGLVQESSNKTPYIAFKGLGIEKFQAYLHVHRLSEHEDGEFDFSQSLHCDVACLYRFEVVANEDKGSFKYPLNTLSTVSIVFGGANMRAKFYANRPSKTLKKWYQEWGVSPLLRKSCAVIMHNSMVVAVILNRVNEVHINQEGVQEEPHLNAPVIHQNLQFLDSCKESLQSVKAMLIAPL